MRVELTEHVKRRRKRGVIPEFKLLDVAKFIIIQHNLHKKKNGVYKFRKAGTQAIIAKKKNKFVFITFFGSTGYVLKTKDYGDFNCSYQSPEVIKAKKDKNRRVIKRALMEKE